MTASSCGERAFSAPGSAQKSSSGRISKTGCYSEQVYGEFAEILKLLTAPSFQYQKTLGTLMPSSPKAVYVDVDDTPIRTAGTMQSPITRAVEYVKRLHAEGSTLYLWSRGGADYFRGVALSLGIADLFQACVASVSADLPALPSRCALN
jgi:hypothetical protein